MLRWVLPAFAGILFLTCNQDTTEQTGDGSLSQGISSEEALARPRPKRIRRPPPLNKTKPPGLLSASHILIQYKGAKNAKTSRTKEEARALAKKVLGQVKGGARFSSLAMEHSDSPDQRAGGYLRIFPPIKRFPEFSKAVKSVEFGEIVPTVIESEFGYHVVRREQTVHIGHVLVMHKESRFAHEGITTRTPEEAKVEASSLHKLLVAEGADRVAIAKKSSDCRRSKEVGGDLGYFDKTGRTIKGGRLMPELASAVVELKVGQTSKVTTSDYGFHVVWRYADEPDWEGEHNAQAVQKTSGLDGGVKVSSAGGEPR